MDKHLNFMVKQTERYAKLLATASEDLSTGGIHDNYNTTDDENAMMSDGSTSSMNGNNGHMMMMSGPNTSASDTNQDSDSDFEEDDNNMETQEDMSTLLEEENEAAKDGNYKEKLYAEMNTLGKEAEQPLDELLPPGYLQELKASSMKGSLETC